MTTTSGLQVQTAYRLAPTLDQILARDSADAQVFRSLATELLVRHVDKGRRGLAVCGAASGAGVSFLAVGLALSLSQIGVDTLLVDANLRAPALDQLIVHDGAAGPGLLQHLQEAGPTIEDILHQHVMPDLSLIYAGGQSTHPQELFDTERFREVIGASMRRHQLLIVDTPPFSRCAEARRIAAVTGYAVVVGRAGASYAKDIDTLCADLAADRVELVGSILNGVSKQLKVRR